MSLASDDLWVAIHAYRPPFAVKQVDAYDYDSLLHSSQTSLFFTLPLGSDSFVDSFPKINWLYGTVRVGALVCWCSIHNSDSDSGMARE